MEEVQSPKFARIVGFICLAVGVFSLIFGGFFESFFGGGLVYYFPILVVLIARPIFALTRGFPLGRMIYQSPYQWSESYSMSGSLMHLIGFSIEGWIIAIIGGLILTMIGLSLLKGKKHYLAYALFFIGSILEWIIGFFEGGSYDLSVVFMIFINIPIGIYFLKLWEKDRKKSYEKNR